MGTDLMNLNDAGVLRQYAASTSVGIAVLRFSVNATDFQHGGGPLPRLYHLIHRDQSAGIS
jgi:hypothetical protein